MTVKVHRFEPQDFNATVGATAVDGGQIVDFVAGSKRTVIPAAAASAVTAGWVPYPGAVGARIPVYRGKIGLVKASGAVPIAGTRLITGAAGVVVAIGVAAADDARRICAVACEPAVDGAYFEAVIL